MNHYLIEFAVVVAAVLFGYLIVAGIKRLRSPRVTRFKRPPFAFAGPIDSLGRDFGSVFWHVQQQLDRDWKSDAFPVPISLGESSTWCSAEMRLEVVSALLEQAGWVVTRDESCGPRELIVDIPRKKLQPAVA